MSIHHEDVITHFTHKRPTGLNGHLIITDSTLISFQRDFSYQQPHLRIDKNQHRKTALQSLNTIAIKELYIDRVKDNAYSL